jgi:hypothetical protein
MPEPFSTTIMMLVVLGSVLPLLEGFVPSSHLGLVVTSSLLVRYTSLPPPLPRLFSWSRLSSVSGALEMTAGLPSISACVLTSCAAIEDGPYGSFEWR